VINVANYLAQFAMILILIKPIFFIMRIVLPSFINIAINASENTLKATIKNYQYVV